MTATQRLRHAAAPLLAAAAAAAPAPARPNIVLVLADDVGFETLACYGGTSWPTPHLDRLAADGTRFDSCLATPMCAPSRAMLLTGRCGFRNYARWAHLDPGEETLATRLRAAGYATGMAGKWHLGNWEPDAHGRRGPGRFVFFHYASNLVHRPLVAVAGPTAADLGEHGRARHFPAMLAKFDEVVGRLRRGLEDLGLAGNTLFLLASDNGTDNVWEARALRSQWRGRTVRGGKYLVNELGTTVPFLACWPGSIPAGAHTRCPVDFTDFLPTLLELAGAPAAADTDGASFLPILLGRADPLPRRRAWTWGTLDGTNHVYHDPPGNRGRILHALRDERWRYLSDGRLFDVAADPLMREPVAPGASAGADAARARLRAELERLLASQPRLW